MVLLGVAGNRLNQCITQTKPYDNGGRRGGGGGDVMNGRSRMSIRRPLHFLYTIQCRDGARRGLADQADILMHQAPREVVRRVTR